jgi:hypothetical protein
MSTPEHPFANAKGVLEVLPNDIDIEEELKKYDEICWVSVPVFYAFVIPQPVPVLRFLISVLAPLYLVFIISSPP